MLIYLHSMAKYSQWFNRSLSVPCSQLYMLLIALFPGLHCFTAKSYSDEWQSDFVTCEMSSRQSVETHDYNSCMLSLSVQGNCTLLYGFIAMLWTVIQRSFLAWHSITMGNNFSFAAFLIVTQALTTITILVREFISVLLVLIVTICIESRKLSFNVQEKWRSIR